MSSPINPLRMAQMVSYAKGQEVNRENSAEKREQDRLYDQKAQLAKQLKNQNKTANTQKGILA